MEGVGPETHVDKTLNIHYSIQNTEYRTQNPESRIQNTEYRTQNTEYRIQNTEYKKLTIYGPLIDTALYVMLLMWENPLLGKWDGVGLW